MPATIQCTHCGVVLNIPENAAGRRLKCPKCGEKFHVGPAVPVANRPPSGAPESNPNSTLLLHTMPNADDLPMMQTGGGDLRESFDLPMMTEAATPAASKSLIGPTGGDVADARALFGESPAPRRKKTGAEARAASRRCPTCGGVVPAGMSLCQKCGLDLESGTRIDLTDDLAPPPPPAPTGMPIPMAVVGGLCLAASVALTGLALFECGIGAPGAVYFVPIALFAIYASVQFLRGKTVKLLLVALTLGAVLDLAFMIASPILQANNATAPIEASGPSFDDPEIEKEIIKPLAERLDTRTITQGIGLLVLYAGVSIYLMSPQVHRNLRR